MNATACSVTENCKIKHMEVKWSRKNQNMSLMWNIFCFSQGFCSRTIILFSMCSRCGRFCVIFFFSHIEITFTLFFYATPDVRMSS